MNPPVRQSHRKREPLPLPELHRLLGLALESAWDPSTRRAYRSHLSSYLEFIQIHNLDPNPTEHTLALYVVFMSQTIKPSSVEVYLTGIVHFLTPTYPAVRAARSSRLVTQALRGCKKLYNVPVVRKRPLHLSEIEAVAKSYRFRHSHNDYLFLSQLLVGFFGLLRLGELVYPNDPTLDCPRKMTARQSLSVSPSDLSFVLPYHKADRFYEGNKVLILANSTCANPILAIQSYLSSRDQLFPKNRDLWILHDGTKPRRSWFLNRLHEFFDSSVGGHSLRAGGATALAERGVPFHFIQTIGRWSSEAFRIYVRQHPLVLHASITETQH